MQYYGDLLRKLTNSNTTEICEFFVKKCMMNARNHAANEGMKRFFMVCAVSANDGIKELLVKNDLTFSGYWAHRRYFAKVKDAVPVVVKSYLSCLLLVLAAQKELIREKTGYELFLSVNGDAVEIKERMAAIEDGGRLGRLYDIDVIRLDGQKVSREEFGLAPRTCLLCGQPAHACSRSRRHSVAELVEEIQTILREGSFRSDE